MKKVIVRIVIIGAFIFLILLIILTMSGMQYQRNTLKKLALDKIEHFYSAPHDPVSYWGEQLIVEIPKDGSFDKIVIHSDHAIVFFCGIRDGKMVCSYAHRRSTLGYLPIFLCGLKVTNLGPKLVELENDEKLSQQEIDDLNALSLYLEKNYHYKNNLKNANKLNSSITADIEELSWECDQLRQ